VTRAFRPEARGLGVRQPEPIYGAAAFFATADNRVGMPKKTATVELVVRRGALRRFHKLKQKTAELPVTVSWDRRQTERRAAANRPVAERRAADRRQAPPYTWDASDFVVVARPRPRKLK
jgi:hypothetical protein